MKKLLFATGLCLLTMSVSAQKIKNTSNKTEANSNYLGLTTGVNNIGGFAGLTFEAPFSPSFSGKIGLGIGAWGVKLGLAGKYYKEFPSSWSFGAGYSTASGLKNVDLELDVNGSQQKVKMNLNRAHLLDFVIGKAWGDKIRFGLEFGYSVPVSGGTYAPVDKSVTLSETSKKVLNVLSPSGLIFGMGLGFRL